jgi:hypothetical protein
VLQREKESLRVALGEVASSFTVGWLWRSLRPEVSKSAR